MKRGQPAPELELDYLYARFDTSRCGDPRDVVYSLLSLPQNAHRGRLLPDYSHGTAVENVFVQRFCVIVDDTQSLDFIFRANHPPLPKFGSAET